MINHRTESPKERSSQSSKQHLSRKKKSEYFGYIFCHTISEKSKICKVQDQHVNDTYIKTKKEKHKNNKQQQCFTFSFDFSEASLIASCWEISLDLLKLRRCSVRICWKSFNCGRHLICNHQLHWSRGGIKENIK